MRGSARSLLARCCDLGRFSVGTANETTRSSWLVNQLRNLTSGHRILTIDDVTPNGNYFEWLGQEVRRLPELSNRNLGHRGLAWWKRLAMGWVLRWLQELSETDYGSAELLNFGYHVRAHKDR